MRHPFFGSAILIALFSVSSFSFIASVSAAATNGGFDHRAHSVPGADQTVYDINGDNFEVVQLDGVGSHSHFFDAGPPVISGVIVSYEWRVEGSDVIFCNTVQCTHSFPVGDTRVILTVVDNTGDVVSDSLVVTVLPQSSMTNVPVIHTISPNRGQAVGENVVTIDGSHLYRDSTVYFGSTPAIEIEHVDRSRIKCKAPGGTGVVSVTVVSASMGSSNGLSYEFQVGTVDMPIRFVKDTWTNPDGSEFLQPEITCITLGRDHRYYMGSLLGTVTAAFVDRSLTVVSSCTGAYMGEDRSITGIAYNPLDPYDRLFVSTNTHFFVDKGGRWDNAKIETVEMAADGCPIRGGTIISGLPVANHDHGTNVITFMRDGRMLISVGSTSNAGVSMPGDGVGGIKESPLSGAIVLADYLRPNFNGEIIYDQYDDPGTANIISGDVKTYVTGVRNSFGMVVHSNGIVYATDNGPNTGFGNASISCTENGPDPESNDKVLRLAPGAYFGHPNRNRGRTYSRECHFRHADTVAAEGYTAPIGRVESSTNGIIEYRANTFLGALKGDLLMSKVAFGAEGRVWRAGVTEDGNELTEQPYEFVDDSGLSFTMGLYGELVMPQLKKYRVLAFRPHQAGSESVDIIAVNPQRGFQAGGNEVYITGHFLNSPGLEITFGGNPCTNLADITYQHVRCIVPPGSGKVSVVAKAGGTSSISYGHEYEYL